MRDQNYLGGLKVKPGVPVARLVPATIRQVGWDIGEIEKVWEIEPQPAEKPLTVPDPTPEENPAREPASVPATPR